MHRQTDSDTPYMVVFRAFIFPIIAAGIATAIASNYQLVENPQAVTLAVLGLVSLALGLPQFGGDGLSFRNGRPMFAGIGFAFLAWIGLLIARFIAVGIGGSGRNLGITFLFLLIFEAFCVQLWTFGLLFRAMVEWRTPLTATIYTGVIFGFAAYLLYGEAQYAFVADSFTARFAILYFVVWGILYAVIRLRAGSFMGVALIQALQTLTVWHMLTAVEPISMIWFYSIGIVIFAVIIWRLWPKYTSDFRI
ncbi:MAG: hypothetical protein ACPG8W_05125 [Candidatus Promineifilaceae bacterium]